MARRKSDKASSPQPATSRPASAQAFSAVAPPTTRADYVESVLRQEIASGQTPPGTPIVQDEIAARLGVSITPVREALRRLESVGLVVYETHFGATVAELGRQQVEELYLLRAVVEGLAARLAAASITESELADLRRIHEEGLRAAEVHDVAAMASGSRAFHRAVATAGGHTIVARHLQQIWEAHPVPVGQSIWSKPELAKDAFDFHERILDALERRDMATSEQLMLDHVQIALADRMKAATPSSPE